MPPHSDRVASRASCLRGGRWTSAAVRACRRHRECSGCPQAGAQDSAQVLTLQQPDLWERGALECPGLHTVSTPLTQIKELGRGPAERGALPGLPPAAGLHPRFPPATPTVQWGECAQPVGAPASPERRAGRAARPALGARGWGGGGSGVPPTRWRHRPAGPRQSTRSSHRQSLLLHVQAKHWE